MGGDSLCVRISAIFAICKSGMVTYADFEKNSKSEFIMSQIYWDLPAKNL